MKTITKLISILFLTMVCYSCSYEESRFNEIDQNAVTESRSSITLEDNILSFSSKEDLIMLLENEDQDGVTSKIENFAHAGFQPLTPYFKDLEGVDVDNFLSRKASRLSKKGILHSFNKSKEEIDLDDDLIADSKFASVLNEDREIIVNGIYYIYTTNGLYFCKKEKKKKLLDYLNQLEITDLFNWNRSESSSTHTNEHALNFDLNPVRGKTVQIDQDINLFVVEYENNPLNPFNQENKINPNYTDKEAPILSTHSFPVAVYTENSLWQKVFGNTIDVNQYHDSDHRIKTKFYNNNYFLWSTIGATARYQKKRLIGWSESETSDGVRLGINHAIYTYNLNFSPFKATDPKRVTLKYKGISYDMVGNVVPQYPGPSNWPINPAETLAELEIGIFGDEPFYTLTGKDANKTINNLLKMAANRIPSLASDMQNDKVNVAIFKFLPTKYQFSQTAVVLKHRSEANRNFDFNFLLSWSSNKPLDQQLLNQLKGKKYASLEVDMYGAALRNGVWKGTRILGKAN